MSNVGRGAQGTVYTGKSGLPPSFLPIGTGSGLTDNGVIIGGGTGPFTASNAGTNGQVIIASTGNDPAFASLTSSGGTITFTPGSNSLNLEAGGGSVANTYTTDSGNAIPAAGVLNVLGRSGSKTGGSGSTLTVRSPPYSDQALSTTVTLNSGSFATAAITLTTPATAGLLDGDLLEFVATNGVLVIQLAATQVAHLGSVATSAAGTLTSTLTGDSISLRYQASTNDWWATSSIGTWVLA